MGSEMCIRDRSGSNSFLNGLFEVDRVLALVCLGLVCVRRGDAGERALFLGVSLGLRRRLLDVKRLAFTRAISLFWSASIKFCNLSRRI